MSHLAIASRSSPCETTRHGLKVPILALGQCRSYALSLVHFLLLSTPYFVQRLVYVLLPPSTPSPWTLSTLSPRSWLMDPERSPVGTTHVFSIIHLLPLANVPLPICACSQSLLCVQAISLYLPFPSSRSRPLVPPRLLFIDALGRPSSLGSRICAASYSPLLSLCLCFFLSRQLFPSLVAASSTPEF